MGAGEMKCPKCQSENLDNSHFCSECGSDLSSSEKAPVSVTATVLTPRSVLPLGSLFAGKYRILEERGWGGMGVVYKAEETKLKRPVALKVLRQELSLDVEAKERLLIEAQAAAALSHPNICTIHEIDEAEGKSYISMEYVEGRSLREKIRSGPLDYEETVNIAIEVAEGLEEAHKKGIIHRDIKSANIMVTEKGQAKIMDFGLAKLRGGSGLTREGTTVGTIAYMSPEQARGAAADGRTDIWSLGIVLYEMLTCHLPFWGDSEHVILYSILNQDLPTLTKWRADVPPALVRIIERCLEKDPSSRYQTAAVLKSDLVSLTEGKVLLKRRLPLKAFALAGGIVLVLLILWLFSPWILKKIGFKSIPEEKHLAVLPLIVVGGDSSDEAFCTGLAENLTSMLTQLERFQERLWVVPTSEVRRIGITSASEAKKSLGVTLAINGSIQRIGDKIRLILNLIDTTTLRQLRSMTRTERKEDISGLQDAVVNEVIGMLDIELQPQARSTLTAGGTTVPGAYEFYLQGCGYKERYEIDENIGTLDTAMNLFQKAIDLDPAYALAHAGLAEAYWGKYTRTKDTTWIEKAESSCDRAIQINDQLAPVHVTLGIISKGTGRYEEAIQEFKRALAQDPGNFEANLQLAAAYEQVNKLGQAEETYKKAIELRPNYWGGYSFLGVFYYLNARYAEAEKLFKQVTELVPDNYNGYNNLATIYFMTGRNDMAAAMWEKSIAVKPNGPACSNLGTLYFYQGKYAEATAMFEKAVKLEAMDYMGWGNLADSYRYTPGYSERSKEAYQRAIQLAGKESEINPRDPHLHSSLAGYYANSGDLTNALAELAQARKQAPNDVTVLRKCVLVFEIGGQRDQALRALQELIQRGGSLEDLATDPALSGLSKDPRYKKIIERGEAGAAGPPKETHVVNNENDCLK